MSRTSINPYCPYCRVRHDALKINRCRELADEEAGHADDTPDATASEPLSEAHKQAFAQKVQSLHGGDMIAAKALADIFDIAEIAVAAAATRARAEGAAAERERIARGSERLRVENPMNGDGSNSMLNRVQRVIKDGSLAAEAAILDERRMVQAEVAERYARLEAENAARGDS